MKTQSFIYQRLPNAPIIEKDPFPLCNMSASLDENQKPVFTPNPVVKTSIAADFSVSELALSGRTTGVSPRRTSLDIVDIENLINE